MVNSMLAYLFMILSGFLLFVMSMIAYASTSDADIFFKITLVLMFIVSISISIIGIINIFIVIIF